MKYVLQICICMLQIFKNKVMENRIKINGKWYIAEDSIKQKNMDVTDVRSCVYENDDYCFQADVIYGDDLKTLHNDVSITITYKNEDKNEEYWDGQEWLWNVYQNNNSNVHQDDLIENILNENGVDDFRLFLGILVERGWLRQPN